MLFFNPIWLGPQCYPPNTTSLPHGAVYANVARLQKWKLLSLHSCSSQTQCCSIVPQQTPNRKIRTCQIWSAMSHASLASELNRHAFRWIPFIPSSFLAVTLRSWKLYVYFNVHVCIYVVCNNCVYSKCMLRNGAASTSISIYFCLVLRLWFSGNKKLCCKFGRRMHKGSL